ncbi:MAG: hypothetical protein ND866_14170 [Pyrinomonadaceae bacterium]|nr:hypothetical protein [Pyrinomonadaceae bacterium]
MHKTLTHVTHPTISLNHSFEVPEGPEGNWSADVIPDTWQARDAQIPVVVAMAGSIQGRIGHRGVRLGCGLLKNRTLNPVAAVQLRWIIARRQDRATIAQQGFTPNTALLSGHTPYIELQIPKENMRRTDFAVINFVEIVRPLLRGGSLNGEYVIYVGVDEVRFEDGSQWKAKGLPEQPSSNNSFHSSEYRRRSS